MIGLRGMVVEWWGTCLGGKGVGQTGIWTLPSTTECLYGLSARRVQANGMGVAANVD